MTDTHEDLGRAADILSRPVSEMTSFWCLDLGSDWILLVTLVSISCWVIQASSFDVFYELLPVSNWEWQASDVESPGFHCLSQFCPEGPHPAVILVCLYNHHTHRRKRQICCAECQWGSRMLSTGQSGLRNNYQMARVLLMNRSRSYRKVGCAASGHTSPVSTCNHLNLGNSGWFLAKDSASDLHQDTVALPQPSFPAKKYADCLGFGITCNSSTDLSM